MEIITRIKNSYWYYIQYVLCKGSHKKRCSTNSQAIKVLPPPPLLNRPETKGGGGGTGPQRKINFFWCAKKILHFFIPIRTGGGGGWNTPPPFPTVFWPLLKKYLNNPNLNFFIFPSFWLRIPLWNFFSKNLVNILALNFFWTPSTKIFFWLFLFNQKNPS